MKRPSADPDDDTSTVIEHDVPEYWMEDDDVELLEFGYSTRHPDDWVSPRTFNTAREANDWGREKYGQRFRGVIQSPDRVQFGVLVRGPRG